MFILLTAEQADAVRGVTTPGNVLAPVALLDGLCALPVGVLDDPAHAKHHALLWSCERVETLVGRLPESGAPDV